MVPNSPEFAYLLSAVWETPMVSVVHSPHEVSPISSSLRSASYFTLSRPPQTLTAPWIPRTVRGATSAPRVRHLVGWGIAIGSPHYPFAATSLGTGKVIVSRCESRWAATLFEDRGQDPGLLDGHQVPINKGHTDQMAVWPMPLIPTCPAVPHLALGVLTSGS
jgi:hypothetical protein